MENNTNHLLFILKPSTVNNGGVGVFALHDIAKGTFMELFREDFQEELRDEKDVPKELQGYCLNHESGKLLCPKFFNRMDIGNYLNHSDNPNLRWEEGGRYFALRDIKAGEELFANCRELGEPKVERDDYYK